LIDFPPCLVEIPVQIAALVVRHALMLLMPLETFGLPCITLSLRTAVTAVRSALALALALKRRQIAPETGFRRH
jgi:hypothetical protein